MELLRTKIIHQSVEKFDNAAIPFFHVHVIVLTRLTITLATLLVIVFLYYSVILLIFEEIKIAHW